MHQIVRVMISKDHDDPDEKKVNVIDHEGSFLQRFPIFLDVWTGDGISASPFFRAPNLVLPEKKVVWKKNANCFDFYFQKQCAYIIRKTSKTTRIQSGPGFILSVFLLFTRLKRRGKYPH